MAGFIGKGRILMGVYDPVMNNRKFFPVGNAEELKLSVSTEEKTLKNYLDCSGGDLETLTRVDKVTVSMVLTDFTKLNIESAVYGLANDTTATAIADESIRCYPGYFTPTAHIINTALPVTVSKGVTPLVAGTDYRVSHAGIEILTTSTQVTGWEDLTIDYTSVAGTVIQALISSGKEVSIIFEGFNQAAASGCSKGVAKLYRMKLSPLKELALIGDDFQKLELEGQLLPDQAITGTGLSKYFKWTMEA